MTGGAAPKRKGSAFEREVAAFLREHGHPNAGRAYGAGRHDDHGDIAGVGGFVIECKAQRSIDLAGFVDEAVREATGTLAIPVVVAKRRGHPTGDAYAVVRLSDWADLLARHDSEAGQ